MSNQKIYVQQLIVCSGIPASFILLRFFHTAVTTDPCSHCPCCAAVPNTCLIKHCTTMLFRTRQRSCSRPHKFTRWPVHTSRVHGRDGGWKNAHSCFPPVRTTRVHGSCIWAVNTGRRNQASQARNHVRTGLVTAGES